MSPTSSSATPKTVVILGASRKPERYSNMLLLRLLGRADYAVIPVHPALAEIEGIAVQASLSSVAADPDVLTLYVGPETARAMPTLESDILRLRPRKVIFNPGAENPALESGLRRAGIDTENACSLVLLSQNAL